MTDDSNQTASRTSPSGDFAARQGVALVTGGSGGIGRAICRVLAERGSHVALSYHRNEESAADVARQLRTFGVQAEYERVDHSDVAASGQWVAGAAERFGGIHTVVHAAGPLVRQLHLSRVEPAVMQQHLLDEAGAFFGVIQPALPWLRASGGSVVAVTTAANHRFPVRDGLSAGPKAAIESMIRGLAAEEGRFGVRANSVGPGMLADGMAQRLQAAGDLDNAALEAARQVIPLPRFGSAVDIAEAVCFLASDRAGYISGQHLNVDGGYSV